MSHISRVNTKMVEKEFLFLALQDLGYDFEEGDFEIKSRSQKAVTVQIRILLPYNREVGLKHTAKGYTIVADWWETTRDEKKKITDTLRQRYAYHAALHRLEEQGFNLVEEQSGVNGSIRLVLRRVA